MFPQLAQFTDLGLLLLRLMVASVFATSGWRDVAPLRTALRRDDRLTRRIVPLASGFGANLCFFLSSELVVEYSA